MTLIEFQSLPEGEKIGTLYREGVYIGKRKVENHILLLYQVDSFYVEVTYRKYRRYIQKIRCSPSTVFLEPYLEQIDVEHLVG